MDAFGRNKAEWLPYWDNAAFVKTGPRGCHASLYLHQKNGVLAVVSNLSGSDARVSVTLSLRKLGLGAASAEATDALTGGKVPINRGNIELDMPNLGWELICVKG